MLYISFRTKLLAGAIGLIVGLGGLTIIFIQTSVSGKLETELQKRGVILANDIAVESIGYLIEEKIVDLKLKLYQNKKIHEDTEYIFVLDHDGKVSAHTFGEAFPADLKGINTASPERKYELQYLNTEKGKILDIAVPILRGELGVVRLGISTNSIREGINNFSRTIAYVVIGISIFAGFITTVLATETTKPISELMNSAKKIGSGNLEHIVNVSSHDEIGQLASTFNQMTKDLKTTTVKRDELVEEVIRRRETEEALRESEKRFRSLFEQAPDSIILFDAGTQLPVEFNDKAHKGLGYTREEFKKLRISDIEVIESKQEVEEHYKKIINEGSDTFETKHRTKDGKILDVLVNARSISIGEENFIQSVLTDITGRKKTEESLVIKDRAIESSINAIGMIDAEANVSIINPSFLKLWRYNDEKEVLGRSVFEFWKDRDKVEDVIRIIGDKGSWIGELAARRKDGTFCDVQVSASVVRDDAGKPVCMMGSFVDISDRKMAEELILQSRHDWEDTFNNITDMITVHDKDFNIIRANRAAEKILGLPFLEDTTQTKCFKYYHGTESSPEGCPSCDCLKTGKSAVFEIFEPHLNMFIEIRAIPRFDSNKELTGLIHVVGDITERRKTEEFIENILESVEEGFVVIDRDYRIISANKAFCEQVKLPFEDIIGELCYKISHRIDKPCYKVGKECAVKNTFETGDPHTAIHTHYDKEGNHFYEETKAYPMKDKFGKFVSVIETINDITEQRKLEVQLRQAQKMEAVGQLAGGIAHDFNNMLTTIIGYGHLLLMRIDDEELRRSVNQILASADRAANLTTGLLAFSRRQMMNPVPVKLNEIVKRTEELLLRLIGENIEMKTELTDKDLTVMADSGQIEQVLMNLVTNARDAMPDGGIVTIQTENIEIDDSYIRVHGYGEPGMFAVISVTDTGEGMDQKTKARIFEPFFTTKDVGEGTGLGLSTIYGIIKQHNGYINAYSELGEGTTFKIYLPITRQEVEEEKLSVSTTVTGGTETVLMAEDDSVVRKIIKEVLEEFGYRVIEAIDGRDAIEKFMEYKDCIQLLIFDVLMPKKNGKEVYDVIRKERPDCRVLFLSGYNENIIYKKGLLEKGINFISKPVAPKELLKKVRGVLDN